MLSNSERDITMPTKLYVSGTLVFLLVSPILLSCNKAGTTGAKTIRIAYVAKLKGESFHEGIAKGIREEAAKKNVTVDMYFGESQQDLQGQVSYLGQILASKKYDGVMLAPNDSSALVREVEKLDKAHIPFILIDTPLADIDESRRFVHNCGFVGTNNYLAGQLAAKFIADRIQKGNVMLMRGNHQHQSSIDREAGLVDELAKHPNVQVLPHLVGFWEEDTAHAVYTRFMQQNTKSIDAVFGYNDPMALGVSKYYDSHPTLQRPVIVGVDGVLVGQRGVLEQKLSATVVQSPEVMGKTGLQNLLRCIGSGFATREHVLTPVTLLKSNFTLETGGT